VKQFADWVAQRPYRAGFIAAALALIPPLGIVGSGFLVLANLRRGSGPAWMAAAIATMVLLAVAVSGGANPVSAGLAGLVFWAPAVGLAEVLRRTGSLDVCVQVAVVAGLLLTGIWLLGSAGWSEVLSREFTPMLEASGFQPEAIAAVMAIIPGAMALSLLLAAVAGLLLGMWWHAALASPGALGKAFRGLRLGRMLAGLGALVLVGGLLTGSPVFANLLVITGAAFVLQGMAIVHGVAASKHWPPGALVVFYVVLVFGMSFVAPLLSVLGLVDNWTDIRARAAES
jgi:hypothetical protein